MIETARTITTTINGTTYEREVEARKLLIHFVRDDLERGAKVNKEYLRLFPSLNASFNITENLVARGAVYTSVGRPDFAQYGGSITLPNTENPPCCFATLLISS